MVTQGALVPTEAGHERHRRAQEISLLYPDCCPSGLLDLEEISAVAQAQTSFIVEETRTNVVTHWFSLFLYAFFITETVLEPMPTIIFKSSNLKICAVESKVLLPCSLTTTSCPTQNHCLQSDVYSSGTFPLNLHKHVCVVCNFLKSKDAPLMHTVL